MRGKGNGGAYYNSIRDHRDPSKFETLSVRSVDAFDDLFAKCAIAFSQPMNVRFEFSQKYHESIASRKRALRAKVMFSAFWVCIRGGIEGGIVVENDVFNFAVSKRSISN